MEEEEEVKRKERKKKKARIKEMPDGDVPSAPVLQDFMGKNKRWRVVCEITRQEFLNNFISNLFVSL